MPNRNGESTGHNEAWERSGGNCFLCGYPMLRGSQCEMLNFTVEHIVPRSRGGRNDVDNRAGAHQLCNNRKGNRTMDELDERFVNSIRWEIRKLLKGWLPDHPEILRG